MAGLVDTHAHLDDTRYATDLDQVLSDAFAGGVSHIVCPGCDLESSKAAKAIADAHPQVYYAIGIHPHEAKAAEDGFYPWARGLSTSAKLVAVGEIGLDYHYDYSPRGTQVDVFRRQIELAYELQLPIIVHDREAHGDVVEILTASKVVGGVLHCYSGSWETAKRCLDMGFYISFAGPVTFKNATGLREVAAKIPADRLLSETDGPYLAPEPHRGVRNEPRYVVEVVRALSQLHGIDLDTMVETIAQNAEALFGFCRRGETCCRS